MVASHYAYNTLKMPGPLGVLTIQSDEKDAIICVDKMYRDVVVVVEEATVPAKESKGKNRNYRASITTPIISHTDLACNTSYHFAASRTGFPRVSHYHGPGPFAPFGSRI